jgi:ABC-type sugar transport system ATPase subunit
MATIQLRDVSRIYAGREWLAPAVRAQGMIDSKVDRAYSERVRAQQRLGVVSGDGKVRALDHVDLTVPDGETLSIVGPSGCGKSTLLRIVAGLDPEYTGRVLYDDKEMRGVPPRERYIGMVFQNYALYPHFLGHGNLSFFFRLHKRTDEETEERIRATSEIMGIGFDELLKRRPGTLSGGQQQRVAIGRAIVRNPVLFLFDEPLSNLDAKLRMQTRIEIKRLLRRFQITAIYVTHDQVEAVTLGDRIAVMREGQIEQVGTYQELLDRPATAFVAGFLGQPPMNLFAKGIVCEGRVCWENAELVVPARMRARVREGQTLTVGARPERAEILGSSESTREGLVLRGNVATIEPDFGRGTQLVYAQSGPFLYAARAVLDSSMEIGDEVRVAFPEDALYFFSDTGSQFGEHRLPE